MLAQIAEGAVQKGNLALKLGNIGVLNEFDTLNASIGQLVGQGMGSFALTETVA